MSPRIHQNNVFVPRPVTEQKPAVVSTPPPSVQGPAASTPAQGVNGSSFKTKAEVLNLQGSAGPGADSVQRQLAVNSTYARIMEEPETARALNSLRVRDGAALAALGNLLASGKLPLWPDKQASLDKLRQGQPELFNQLITLAQQLGTNAPVPARTPDVASTQAASALTAAQGTYDQAKSHALGLDQQLSRELDALGPALNGAQRRAYIEAFHNTHQTEYDRASVAEADLAATLNNPALDESAAQDLNVAYAAARAAETLAGGSHSVDVLKWASRVMDGSNAAQDMFEQTQTGVSMPGWTGTGPSELRAPVDFDALRGEALAGAAGQLFAEANGDPQAALAHFSAMTSALGGDTAKTNEMLAALTKASAGDFSALSQMPRSADPITRGLGTAATVFAGLTAKGGPQQAAYGQFLQDLAASGKADVLGDALHSLAGASSTAAEGSPVNAQMASSVAALATALSGQRAEPLQLFNGSTYEDGGQLLSDLSTLAGNGVSALASTADLVTDTVSELITDLGEQMAEASHDNSVAETDHLEREKETLDADERKEQTEDLLEKAGVQRTLARALAQSAELPKMLRTKVGLTPAQISSLAVSHPDLFASARAAQEGLEFAKASGMRGENVHKFFDALAKDDAHYLQTLAQRGEELSAGDQASRELAARLFPKAIGLARQVAPDRFAN